MPDPIGGVQPFAELARGEASVVYKGYRRSDRRLVLLKTVRPESGDEGRLARFEEEARLAAQVTHPNVVAVLDAGRDGATAYLVTEFVEGIDLDTLIERGPLPSALAGYVLHEVARGLAAVHAEDILHRDLKPANLLVSSDGAVKLTDFGFASLVPPGVPMPDRADAEVRGTLGYLAPELVRGDPPSPAADLFSLGAVLLEMLTGRPVFARRTEGDTLDAVLHHDPIPALKADPRVPPALAALAAALIEKNPARRPPNAEAVLDMLAPIRNVHPAGPEDLAAYLSDPASYVPATPLATPPATPNQVRAEGRDTPSRRTRWGIAAGVLLLLGMVGATLLMERRSGPPEERGAGPLASVAADSAEERAVVSPDTTRELAVVPPFEPDVPEEEPTSAAPASEEVETMTEAEAADTTTVEDTGPVLVPAAETVSDSAGSGQEPEALPGTVVIAAEPWARVRVDGEVVGTTPFGALSLPPGRHVVAFENPDFPPHSVEISVEGGEETRLAVSLWDLVGRVTFAIRPWAEVAVNGAYWDTVPPQERPLVLTPGTHRLTFAHPAFGTRETTLRIAAGESRTLRIDLSE